MISIVFLYSDVPKVLEKVLPKTFCGKTAHSDVFIALLIASKRERTKKPEMKNIEDFFFFF